MQSDTSKSRGFVAAVRHFLNEPMPNGIGWPHTFGSALLALAIVQLTTGTLLSMYYSANADSAYESILFIETQVLFGSLIRGIHYFAASAMVILIFLHVARTFYYGSYKKPRQWTWILGVCLLLVVLGFAFTGYLLPWDMKAYFATKVGINIGGVAPFVGSYIVKIMQGGDDLSTITLSRFFALHVIVLPIALLIIAGLHVFLVRQHGETPPWLRNDEETIYQGRFYPQQMFRDSIAALLVISVVVFLASEWGAPLEERADPNSTSYVPRPDWYFYSLFQLLKIFPGRLEVIGAVVIPGAFFTALFLLPFLDRNPERRLSERPVARWLGTAVLISVVSLTAWGVYDEKTADLPDLSGSAVTVEGELEPSFVVSPDVGRNLYAELKCNECHGQSSAGENTPPGLEFSGDKYQESWIAGYLQDPFRVRWQSRNQRPVIRMPDFDLSEQEALNLAAYLMSLRKPHLFDEPEFDWADADSEMVLSGAELFFEYGCTGCHRIGDDGQDIGPALTRAGTKLTDTYLFNIIQSPGKIIPGTGMKNLQLETEVIEDIVAYLRQRK